MVVFQWEKPTQAGVDLPGHIQWRGGEAFSKELQHIILKEVRGGGGDIH